MLLPPVVWFYCSGGFGLRSLPSQISICCGSVGGFPVLFGPPEPDVGRCGPGDGRVEGGRNFVQSWMWFAQRGAALPEFVGCRGLINLTKTCSCSESAGLVEEAVANLTASQRDEVNQVIDTLRVLVGAKGTKLAFNDVLMASNSVGSSIVIQCVSRCLGTKFSAEFVAYGFVGEQDVTAEDPWFDGIIEVPVTLDMLVTELQDLRFSGVCQAST